MKSLLTRTLGATALVAAFCLFLQLAPPEAVAQSTFIFPSKLSSAGFVATQFGGIQATTANSSTSLPTNSYVTINDGGFGVWVDFQGSNTSDTGNVVYTFYPSFDGTNYASAGAFTYTAASNGTNIVIGFTNFAAANAGNIRSIQLYSIANSAGHTITNNWVTVGQYSR